MLKTHGVDVPAHFQEQMSVGHNFCHSFLLLCFLASPAVGYSRYQFEIPDALIRMRNLVLPKMGVYRDTRNVINSFRSSGLIGEKGARGTELPTFHSKIATNWNFSPKMKDF